MMYAIMKLLRLGSGSVNYILMEGRCDMFDGGWCFQQVLLFITVCYLGFGVLFKVLLLSHKAISVWPGSWLLPLLALFLMFQVTFCHVRSVTELVRSEAMTYVHFWHLFSCWQFDLVTNAGEKVATFTVHGFGVVLLASLVGHGSLPSFESRVSHVLQ